MFGIKAGDIKNDEGIQVETLKNHYVNFAENSTGVVPIELGIPTDPNWDRDTVKKILKHYKNHRNIIQIKKLAKTNESFTFPSTKTEDINEIINWFKLEKARRSDGITIKVI